MDSRSHIVTCTTSSGSRPVTLAEAGHGRIVKRTIAGWKPFYGTYGMGGPGFFGLELAANSEWLANDHLVLTLWSAGCWLLLDDEWVEAHPDQYAIRRPLYSNFGPDLNWDDVTSRLVGGTIEQFELGRAFCRMTMKTRDTLHVLELPEDTTRLSRAGGTLESRWWHPQDDIADAWVICDGDLVC